MSTNNLPKELTNIDPQKIKALALDLDGTTLLPDTSLGERTAAVLKKLISGGMQIILATGRSSGSAERYCTALGAEGPMVFFNGAEVVDVPSGKLLNVNLVGKDVMDFCIDISRSMDIFFQFYLPAGISPDTGEYDPQKKRETLIIEKPCLDADLYQKHTRVTAVEKDLKKIIALPNLKGCLKGMFITDSSMHNEIREKLNERFGNSINIIRSSSTLLEILNGGVSKGEGLKIAMRHRGLKPEEVMAFGDEENDLSMFEAVGFSAAPISAREIIREKAGVIFGSNAEEGLAIYLEKTFL